MAFSSITSTNESSKLQGLHCSNNCIKHQHKDKVTGACFSKTEVLIKLS